MDEPVEEQLRTSVEAAGSAVHEARLASGQIWPLARRCAAYTDLGPRTIEWILISLTALANGEKDALEEKLDTPFGLVVQLCVAAFDLAIRGAPEGVRLNLWRLLQDVLDFEAAVSTSSAVTGKTWQRRSEFLQGHRLVLAKKLIARQPPDAPLPDGYVPQMEGFWARLHTATAEFRHEHVSPRLCFGMYPLLATLALISLQSRYRSFQKTNARRNEEIQGLFAEIRSLHLKLKTAGDDASPINTMLSLRDKYVEYEALKKACQRDSFAVLFLWNIPENR